MHICFQEIPNHKHQIANKSQITIFNDQNIVSQRSVTIRVLYSCFEFRILVIVIYLYFVICYLEFFWLILLDIKRFYYGVKWKSSPRFRGN